MDNETMVMHDCESGGQSESAEHYTKYIKQLILNDKSLCRRRKDKTDLGVVQSAHTPGVLERAFLRSFVGGVGGWRRQWLTIAANQ